MEVRLSKQFGKDLDDLAKAFGSWDDDSVKRLVKAHKRIGVRHKGEAVKRVPVDQSTLKQRITTHTDKSAAGTDVTTETGTNVPDYPIFLEFGTRYIAGGRVKALGDGVGITDAQAVKDWPAKTGSRQQMPWLRPAFNSIRAWALKQIEEAFRPPKQ